MPTYTTVLALLLATAGDAAPLPDVARERIAAVRVAADGRSGEIHTIPERLSQDRARYQFGQHGCPSLAPRVLDLVLEAAQNDRVVHIEPGSGAGPDAARCVRAITVFSP